MLKKEDCPGLILYQGIFEGEYVDPLNIPLENIEKFSIFTDSMQLYP